MARLALTAAVARKTAAAEAVVTVTRVDGRSWTGRLALANEDGSVVKIMSGVAGRPPYIARTDITEFALADA